MACALLVNANSSANAKPLDFSLEKKSPAKETRKKIKLEVNSNLIFV